MTMIPPQSAAARRARNTPSATVVSRRTRSGGFAAVLGGSGIVSAAYVLGVRTAAGRAGDVAAVRTAEHASWTVRDGAHALLVYASVPAALATTAVIVLWCLRAGRRHDAIRTVVLVAGAEALTELVKLVLPRPGGENTLPSGHVTLVAAVAVAAVLAAAPQHRHLVGWFGSATVALVAVATWVTGWHRPSDVAAALGVVAVCWGLGTLYTASRHHGRARTRQEVPRRRPRTAPSPDRDQIDVRGGVKATSPRAGSP